MRNLRNNKSMQKVMALYVIAALLFQIYLLATMVLNPSQVHSQSWLSDAQNEKVLLCTSEGFKWVNVDELINANNHSESVIDSAHEPLKFSCPLLDVFKLSAIVAAFLLATVTLWLARYTPTISCYQHIGCRRDLYLLIAPKQSPPLSVFK